MCVIGYAPKNATIDDSTVRIMFENNPDGAGIMWKPEGKPVEILKGFFSAEALLKAWHKVPIECEKAIHCRIATAGKVTGQCCHPFPVREVTRAMKSKSDCSEIAFMHNGIITLTDPPLGIKSPYSDSMMFGKEILYPLKDALDSEYIQEMLEDSINSSRLLIFRQYGKTIRLGRWVKDGKCYFSNDSYKDSYYKYYSCGSYSSGGYSYVSTKSTKSTKAQGSTTKTEAPKLAQTTTNSTELASNVGNAYNYEESDMFDNSYSLPVEYDTMDSDSGLFTIEELAYDVLDNVVPLDKIETDKYELLTDWFEENWDSLTSAEQRFVEDNLGYLLAKEDGEKDAATK